MASSDFPCLVIPRDETSRNPVSVSFSRNGWEPWLKGTKNLRRHQRGREIHYFPSKNQGIFKGFPEFLNHAWWHRGSTDRAQENAPRWAADFTRIPAIRASFGSRTRQHKNGMTMDDTSYGRTIGPPRAGCFIMENPKITGMMWVSTSILAHQLVVAQSFGSRHCATRAWCATSATSDTQAPPERGDSERFRERFKTMSSERSF